MNLERGQHPPSTPEARRGAPTPTLLLPPTLGSEGEGECAPPEGARGLGGFWGDFRGFWEGGYLANLQSEAMWPAPPHLVQTVVLVMLRVSVLCHGRRILPRQKNGGVSYLWVAVLFWGEIRAFRGGGGGRPVIVLPQRPVEARQLPQLHLPQVVLVLGRLDALLQDVPDLGGDGVFLEKRAKSRLRRGAEAPPPLPGPPQYLLHRFLDVLHGVGGDQSVEGLVLPRQHLPVLAPHFPLLHRPFAPDHDFGVALLLDVLQRVPPEVEGGIVVHLDFWGGSQHPPDPAGHPHAEGRVGNAAAPTPRHR